MLEKKFKLLEESKILQHEGEDITLYRIVALRDFSDVEKGDKGGWIESEENLSHEGGAWIYDKVEIFGDMRVSGNIKVSSHIGMSIKKKKEAEEAMSAMFRVKKRGGMRVVGQIDEIKEQVLDGCRICAMRLEVYYDRYIHVFYEKGLGVEGEVKSKVSDLVYVEGGGVAKNGAVFLTKIIKLNLDGIYKKDPEFKWQDMAKKYLKYTGLKIDIDE